MFKALRQDARARPQLFVLDEFDEAPSRTGRDPQSFNTLRSLGDTHITFVVASRAEIHEIEKDAGIKSNYAGIFDPTPIQMGLLPSDEARELCQEPLRANGIDEWNPIVIDALLELSGGHPYLLQGLCHRLLADAWGNSADGQCEILKTIAPEVFYPLFTTLARRLNRNRLIESLCELLQGNMAAVEPAHTDRLEKLGYLKRDGGGRCTPFTPLLPSALRLDPVPAENDQDDRILKENLIGLGFSPGSVNVIVEGETDKSYLELAAEHQAKNTGENLLDGLELVPAGFRRQGGVKVAARRLILAQDTARDCNTRFITLFDYDVIGRKTGEALSQLGGNKNKDYMFLDRKYFPIKNYPGSIEVEIEDLLSRRILDEFAEICPQAVEERLDRGADGIRYCWFGSYKDNLVEHVRTHATLDDLKNLVECLRQVRKNVKL